MKFILAIIAAGLFVISCEKENPMGPAGSTDTTGIPSTSPLIGKWTANLSDTIADALYTTDQKKAALLYHRSLFDTTKWIAPSYPVSYEFRQDSVRFTDLGAFALSTQPWYKYSYTNELIFVLSPKRALYETGYDTTRLSYKIQSNNILFINYKSNQLNMALIKGN